MQTLIKIPSTKGTFTVKVKPETNRIAVSVFHNADKLPVFGTIFNGKENPTEIILWATGLIKTYPKSSQR